MLLSDMLDSADFEGVRYVGHTGRDGESPENFYVRLACLKERTFQR